MLFRLILAFTLIPLVELWLLLQVGAWLGLGPTLGLVIGTGIAGAWLARHEGARSWRAVQERVAAGRLPTDELLHAVLLLVAGIVLVTPGVLTDAAGLLLLVRPVRHVLVRRIRERVAARLEVRRVSLGGDLRGDRPGRRERDEPPASTPAGGRVIEL